MFVIGILMIAAFFVGLFVFMGKMMGFKIAAIMFGASIGLTVWLVLSIFFITGEKPEF